MKNLPLVGFRPLFSIIFLFSCILGCKKDSLTSTGNFSQVNSQELSEKNFPISVAEARMCFERLDAHPSTSFDDGESYTFLKAIEPDWNLAFIGHSQSGKAIVITPLEDSCLNALNQGRAGAKLIFSKTTEDSISVSILVFLADTSYYQGNSGVLNFNTFTGLYLLLDIGQHFEAGLNVIAGSPVGRVKAISQQGSENVLDDREDAEDEDCPRTFESMLIPCEVVFACIDGFQLITIESADCTDAIWPTGGGGSGSGGSGGGGGGGGTGTPNFWGIFYTNMPIETFLQNGGILPPGLDVTRAQHLIEINQVYHLSQSNLQWLADNTLVLDVIYGYFISHPTPTGDDQNAIGRLIALSKNYDLSTSQQIYSANHLDEVDDIYSFAISKDYDHESGQAVKVMIDLRNAGQVPIQYESQVFRQILDQYSELSNGVWPDGLGALWNYAYSIERAKLKYHHPDWGSWRLDLEAAWNVSKEAIHLALDGIGLIPVVGEVADITSGFIYAMEGDWKNATLSVASAVPFVGWFAQGAKHCQKVVNAGGNISKLLWEADNLGKVVFGNSRQLKRMIKPVTDFHAHHIIPWAHREHSIVQSATKVDGPNPWHMNEAGNGIGIHKNYHAGDSPDAHPNYNAAIFQKLENIKNYFGGNFTPTQAYAELEKLRQATRTIITSNPTTHINDLSFTTWPSVLGTPPVWW